MPKKVSDLAANPENPRVVTTAKLAQLKKSMREFGDLSGIVFNETSGNVIGGTQRSKNLDETSKVVITKSFSPPTRTGTTAIGYVEDEGERFNYRQVAWDRHREMAANIAANKGAGEWDKQKLTQWMRELGSFDVDFDIELTMFDTEEYRKKFGTTTVSEHERSTGKDESTGGGFRCVAGDTYVIGTHRLVCGDTDLAVCDEILAVWEKRTGETATLIAADEVDESVTTAGSEGPKPLVKSTPRKQKRPGKKKKPVVIGFAALSSRT